MAETAVIFIFSGSSLALLKEQSKGRGCQAPKPYFGKMHIFAIFRHNKALDIDVAAPTTDIK